MTSRAPRPGRLLAVLVAALVVLGACGVSSSSQSLNDDIERQIKERRESGDASSRRSTSRTTTTRPKSSSPGERVSLPPLVPPVADGPAPPQKPQSSMDRAVAAVSGKGQYLYQMENTGSAKHVVDMSKQMGLAHLILRCGNPADGFYTKDTLRELLPLAHEAGIKVVCYDGPAMEDIPGDVRRAKEMIEFTAPGGHRVDAFGADIERERAINLDGPHASEYGRQLRAALPDYPLIAIVLNPNYHMDDYPFAELAPHFDVMSPMDYWTGRTRDGAGFVAHSIELLRQFGKPISVIGQAYPIEGKKTYPTPSELEAAMASAKQNGAIGISFWAWQYTTPELWQVIGAFRW